MKTFLVSIITAVCIFAGIMAFRDTSNSKSTGSPAITTRTLPPCFKFDRDTLPGEAAKQVPHWRTVECSNKSLIKITSTIKVSAFKTRTECIVWDPSTGSGQWSGQETGFGGGVVFEEGGDVKVIEMTQGSQIGSYKIVFFEKGRQFATGVLNPDWTSI